MSGDGGRGRELHSGTSGVFLIQVISHVTPMVKGLERVVC